MTNGYSGSPELVIGTIIWIDAVSIRLIVSDEQVYIFIIAGHRIHVIYGPSESVEYLLPLYFILHYTLSQNALFEINVK